MVKSGHLEVGKIRVVYETHLHLCVDFNLAYLIYDLNIDIITALMRK